MIATTAQITSAAAAAPIRPHAQPGNPVVSELSSSGPPAALAAATAVTAMAVGFSPVVLVDAGVVGGAAAVSVSITVVGGAVTVWVSVSTTVVVDDVAVVVGSSV